VVGGCELTHTAAAVWRICYKNQVGNRKTSQKTDSLLHYYVFSVEICFLDLVVCTIVYWHYFQLLCFPPSPDLLQELTYPSHSYLLK
jgi:hypothetical protein